MKMQRNTELSAQRQVLCHRELVTGREISTRNWCWFWPRMHWVFWQWGRGKAVRNSVGSLQKQSACSSCVRSERDSDLQAKGNCSFQYAQWDLDPNFTSWLTDFKLKRPWADNSAIHSRLSIYRMWGTGTQLLEMCTAAFQPLHYQEAGVRRQSRILKTVQLLS